MLALTGQARLDQLPAGDLAFLKLVGRLRSGGDPWARATVEEVEEVFAPYEPWAGIAGMHALRSVPTAAARGALRAAA
jgi:3-methyladenine DNA glycosylase/8-oxoguanine DNA glycosylase